MSKKCKAIITSIMVVLYIILFSHNICNAMSYERPFTTLFSGDWWCIQHGGWLHDNDGDFNYKIVWYEWEYWYTDYTKDPPEVHEHYQRYERSYTDRWEAVWNGPSDGSVSGTCDSNCSIHDRQLAYLLATRGHVGRGTGDPTPEQVALWGLWGGGTIENIDDGMAKIANAKPAAIKAKNGSVLCDNHKIGPMSVEYNGKVDKITVTYDDGSTTTALPIEQGGNTLSSVEDLKQKTNFYIINDTEKEVKNVNVHVTERHTHYWASWQEYEGAGVKVTNNDYSYGSFRQVIPNKTPDVQPVMRVIDSGESPCVTEASCDIKVQVYKGNITIKKYGIKNGKKVILPKMQFKLYCKELDKWVKEGRLLYERQIYK